MERLYPNSFTRNGANALVDRIKAFWNSRGKYPQVWIERMGDDFVVRSNIIGGRPQ